MKNTLSTAPCLDVAQDIRSPELRRVLTVPEIERIQKEGIIQILEFNITNICQLRCPGCYKLEDATKDRQFLPFDRFQKYIEDGLNHGLEEVWLLGGEPTLHPQWRRFFKYAQSRGIDKLTLFSNTIRLGPADIKFLVDNNIRLIGKLNIGNVDNPEDEELAVQSRAIGSHKFVSRIIFDKIRAILDAGLQKKNLFVLENLLRADNFPYAEKFWEFCRSEGVIPNLELFCSTTRAQIGSVALPSDDEIRDLIPKLQAIDAKYGHPRFTPLSPHITSGCSLNYNALAVDFNENILPCAPSPTSVANFDGKDVDFEEVLHHPLIEARRGLTKDNVKGACRNCSVFSECHGGCRTAVEAVTGDPYEASQDCLTKIVNGEI